MDDRLVVQTGGLPVKIGAVLVGGIGVGGAPSGAIDTESAPKRSERHRREVSNVDGAAASSRAAGRASDLKPLWWGSAIGWRSLTATDSAKACLPFFRP